MAYCVSICDDRVGNNKTILRHCKWYLNKILNTTETTHTDTQTQTHAQSHVTQAGNVNKKLKTLITQTSWPRFHFIAFYLVGFVLFQVFTEIWPILLTACLSSGFHLHFRLSVNRETTIVNNQGSNHHRWTTTNRVQFEILMKREISTV